MFLNKTFKTASILNGSVLPSYQTLPTLPTSSLQSSPLFSSKKLQALELNFLLNQRSLDFTSSTNSNFTKSLSFLHNVTT
jgi:hypothetical protein